LDEPQIPDFKGFRLFLNAEKQLKNHCQISFGIQNEKLPLHRFLKNPSINKINRSHG